MYKPKLKYIFCLMRKRSLMPAMSLMRYMNSVGLVPQLLIPGFSFGEDQHKLIVDELNRYNVKYVEITKLPNYDVMFSEGVGTFSPFEKRWMAESKKLGKTNVMLVNSTSAYRNIINTYFLPEKTGLLDGICMKMEEHLFHYQEFTKDLFLINVGDPDWDWWGTDEFKNEVDKTRSMFGDKILVFGEPFLLPKQAIPYAELCIKQAKSLGFKFVINPHPDRGDIVPEQFRKYCNRNIHHHVLFKAATHIVTSINCSLLAEGLFLGTKVGSDSFIPHCEEWVTHKWLDKNSWLTKAPKHVKQEILDMISFVCDKKDIYEFLSNNKLGATVEVAGKAFGKIVVPCYSEYLFETLDKKLIKEGKI